MVLCGQVLDITLDTDILSAETIRNLRHLADLRRWVLVNEDLLNRGRRRHGDQHPLLLRCELPYLGLLPDDLIINQGELILSV